LRGSVYLDVYKGIHLAIEVTTFIGNLHLRQVSVWSLALESLNLSPTTAIDIIRRERERGITSGLGYKMDEGQ
jgi:hypothetical protein